METTAVPTNKPKKLKTRFFIGLVLVALGLAGYLWYWYRTTAQVRQTAKSVVERATQYERLKGAINQETNRCREFMTGGSGAFAEFEYCKKFIEWAEQNMVR